MKELHKVSFDEDAGIVLVRIVGSAIHEEHCAARDEAVRLCQDKRCSKLLVDLRELATERSSTMSCFSFGESLAGVPLRLRIAHVLPADAGSAKDVKFTSAVEANRGQLTGEFNTVEEARQWLLQE